MTPSRRPVFSLVLTAGLAGCGSEGVDRQSSRALESRVGDTCTVQFRRDALGAASPNPVSPTTDNHGGGETSMTGVLRSVRGDWLILDVASTNLIINGKGVVSEYWVPKQVVLLIKWSDRPPK